MDHKNNQLKTKTIHFLISNCWIYSFYQNDGFNKKTKPFHKVKKRRKCHQDTTTLKIQGVNILKVILCEFLEPSRPGGKDYTLWIASNIYMLFIPEKTKPVAFTILEKSKITATFRFNLRF